MREFGSEYSNAWYQNEYFNTLQKQYEYSCYVRTGREALALAARTICHDEGDVVLMPAYCCRTMEWPFLDYGWKIEYFKLKHDLSVDIDDLLEKVHTLKPKAVLVMNYYGFTDVSAAITIVKGCSNIPVIEDFSHCLLSYDSILKSYCHKPDFCIASIRKSIGVPDGALFMSNVPYKNEYIITQETDFLKKRLLAFREKEKFFYTYDEKLRISSKEKLKAASDSLTRPIEVFSMSNESKDIINHIDIETIMYARNNNYKHLYTLLKDNSQLEILFKPSLSNPCPFSFPVIFKDRYSVQKIMADHGLFLQVIWTISDKAKLVCQNSKRVSENMLSIPMDQRFDYYDIEEIAGRINKYLI